MQVLKYINLIRISSSWVMSTITRSPVVWGMPFSLGIELTNICNLRCPECASGSGRMNRPLGYMSETLFSSVITQLNRYTISTMLYFQGESMLHPEFFRYLEIARGMGVTISTNGHFIDRENASKLANSGVRKIIISMDGFTQKSYSKYRIGGNIDTVKSGVRLLSEKVKGVRNPPTIVLQVIVNRYNENERDQLKQFAKSLGIKVRFKSMQILGERDRENLLPVNQKYSRYITDTGVLKLNSRFQNRCFRLWTNPVITWNGLVVPCCFDKSGKYVMGDLNKSKFSEIWREDNYNQFRARLMSNRKGIDICLNCTSGER